MRIAGFQSLSLIDYPALPCSIIFTQGCIFRCSYCHNPDLIPIEGESAGEGATLDDYLPRLKARHDRVKALCITGGEPTIHADLIDDVKRLKDEGFLIKLDTNGIHPDRLARLIDAGYIDYIAMDLKNVWERYAEVIRVANPELISRCRQSFSLIQQSGIDHEFRTTIHPIAHTREDFFMMASYLNPGERYFVQETRFGKTLDTELSSAMPFDVSAMVRDLSDAHPSLIIFQR